MLASSEGANVMAASPVRTGSLFLLPAPWHWCRSTMPLLALLIALIAAPVAAQGVDQRPDVVDGIQTVPPGT